MDTRSEPITHPPSFPTLKPPRVIPQATTTSTAPLAPGALAVAAVATTGPLWVREHSQAAGTGLQVQRHPQEAPLRQAAALESAKPGTKTTT